MQRMQLELAISTQLTVAIISSWLHRKTLYSCKTENCVLFAQCNLPMNAVSNVDYGELIFQSTLIYFCKYSVTSCMHHDVCPRNIYHYHPTLSLSLSVSFSLSSAVSLSPNCKDPNTLSSHVVDIHQCAHCVMVYLYPKVHSCKFYLHLLFCPNVEEYMGLGIIYTEYKTRFKRFSLYVFAVQFEKDYTFCLRKRFSIYCWWYDCLIFMSTFFSIFCCSKSSSVTET